MILAIDAGNTRIKWGVHDGAAWRASGALATDQGERLRESLAAAGPVDRAIASNVAGESVGVAIAAACRRDGVEATFIRSEASQLGVSNAYRDPGQLGSDRWAALIAAHALEKGNKLVVTAGTALTIDALASDGRFLGGVIVPGPALMRRSLEQATAGLKLTEGFFDDFPMNTPDAITTGSIQACAGAIDRLAERMSARGLAPDRIVLSGGAAAELAERLDRRSVIRETLVLDGLVLIARQR